MARLIPTGQKSSTGIRETGGLSFFLRAAMSVAAARLSCLPASAAAYAQDVPFTQPAGVLHL